MKKKKLLLTILLVFIMACSKQSIKEGENSFIITPDNKYYIHYENMYIELKEDTYITANKKLSDYINSKILFIKNPFSDSELINDLNKYFIHELKGIEMKEVTEISKEIPIIIVNNKNIIDTVLLNKLLAEGISEDTLIKVDSNSDIVGSKEEANVDLSNRSIHILNANGVTGEAKKLGDKLQESLKITYNAENHNEISSYSYIENVSLTQAELDKLVEELGINIIKVRTAEDEQYSANIIMGKNDIKYPIEIVSKTGNSEIAVLLNEFKLTNKKDEMYNGEKIDDNLITIYYSKEDYYIAKYLNKKINRSKIVEDSSLKNKIVITTTR